MKLIIYLKLKGVVETGCKFLCVLF